MRSESESASAAMRAESENYTSRRITPYGEIGVQSVNFNGHTKTLTIVNNNIKGG